MQYTYLIFSNYTIKGIDLMQHKFTISLINADHKEIPYSFLTLGFDKVLDKEDLLNTYTFINVLYHS